MNTYLTNGIYYVHLDSEDTVIPIPRIKCDALKVVIPRKGTIHFKYSRIKDLHFLPVVSNLSFYMRWGARITSRRKYSLQDNILGLYEAGLTATQISNTLRIKTSMSYKILENHKRINVVDTYTKFYYDLLKMKTDCIHYIDGIINVGCKKLKLIVNSDVKGLYQNTSLEDITHICLVNRNAFSFSIYDVVDIKQCDNGLKLKNNAERISKKNFIRLKR